MNLTCALLTPLLTLYISKSHVMNWTFTQRDEAVHLHRNIFFHFNRFDFHSLSIIEICVLFASSLIVGIQSSIFGGILGGGSSSDQQAARHAISSSDSSSGSLASGKPPRWTIEPTPGGGGANNVHTYSQTAGTSLHCAAVGDPLLKVYWIYASKFFGFFWQDEKLPTNGRV